MKVVKTELPGVLILEPSVHYDERGFFLESYQALRYEALGLPDRFVQDNHSRSVQRTIRGLHAQVRRPQGKLIRAIQGSVFDVAVDIRQGSPTFGRWIGVELTAENFRQLYIPPGFAHGFCVTSERADVEYKCTDYYEPGDELGLLWNDQDLAIAWPISFPLLSEKDRRATRLLDLMNRLPRYREAA